ncbi:universal stress protein [Halospeciosus flavus]|uniref:Universal stress protein n=1 Tax=Halospeciosus flavus TaxID=3032283 RepID=A0ABD5Z4K0_9EURY|nr:universal stress protein [Halospeciosus flavus]
MYEVLIPVDDDEERARAQAAAVADLPGRDEIVAHVFHVFTDNPSGASVGQHGGARRARDSLEDAGVEVELHEDGGGNPGGLIVETADDLDVDAICVGARKRSPAGKALLGSTSQDVILSSDRPVIVTGKSK